MLCRVSGDNVLVSINASKDNWKIVYQVECSGELLKEEFEYYLGGIINGVGEWNKDVCEESLSYFEGKIKTNKKKAFSI